MLSMPSPASLTWLGPNDPFPAPELAWSAGSPAPGLLAAGADLSSERLLQAYTQGIFPWFSAGQPVLWFCTDPRMVLRPGQFKLHHDLRKRLRRHLRDQTLSIRMEDDFGTIMRYCAQVPRPGQSGTWIGADMIDAYTQMHRLGHARCITAWINGELAGGLYVVVLGRMVFGESMFTLSSGGSKYALAALVAWARRHHLPLIDCQQETRHLHHLGARPIARAEFLAEISSLVKMTTPDWHFSPIFWDELWPEPT
jgi:leucyl/phenylalanyl-tRNA--protein transferase